MSVVVQILSGQKIGLRNVKTYSSVPEDWTGPIPPGWLPNDATIARLELEKARYEAEKAAAELALAKMRAAEAESD